MEPSEALAWVPVGGAGAAGWRCDEYGDGDGDGDGVGDEAEMEAALAPTEVVVVVESGAATTEGAAMVKI